MRVASPRSLSAVHLAVVSGVSLDCHLNSPVSHAIFELTHIVLDFVLCVQASRGIGLAFTTELLKRTPATIVATSRSASESSQLHSLQQAWPGRIDTVSCDVTDATSTKAMAAHIKGTHEGKVDLLLNVAGLLHEQESGVMPERSLSSVDPAVLQRIMAVNAMGPLLVTQAVAPLLSKGAKIGNVSARVGSISDNRLGGWWSYRMSKAALNMCTVNTANELRRREVIAVSLHPGTTDTDLSAPFQRNVKPEKLFTAGYSAGAMLDVLDGLTLEQSGKFFAYDGSQIEY